MRDGEYINFYRSYGVLPSRQDIHDLAMHFQRRASLYRHLGILPGYVRDRSVLEIGPGSGYNPLYTASLHPKRYMLVEPHALAVAETNKLFEDFVELSFPLEIKNISLEQYESDERFDFVFCESVLCGFTDPNAMLQKVAKYVAPGGILVITCMDDISLFPESLRRLFAQLAVEPDASKAARMKRLCEIFEPHLSRIQGRSKGVESWVFESIINTGWDKHTIPESIAAIDEEFTVFGLSPSFLVDWRWYKTLCGDATQINRRAISQYWQNVHNFVDYRCCYPARKEEENQRLYSYCAEGRRLIRGFEQSREHSAVLDIITVLACLSKEVSCFSAELADIFDEVRHLLAQKVIDWNAFSRTCSFAGLFGRGMQYISFSRNRELP